MSKYYRYLYNEENSEELNQESNLEQPELESLENLEQPEDFGGPFEQIGVQEELDEMESDVRLLQTELHDIERYTPSIIVKITKPQPFAPYLVKVRKNTLQREGPGENYKVLRSIPKHDMFKILEEKKDELGAVWGKLNCGWIPIGDCRKL